MGSAGVDGEPLPGAVPSPNIWTDPTTYEAENRGTDPDGVVEAALRRHLGPGGWARRVVLDVGCGTGYHLPLFAAAPGAAARVVGVEPHPRLAGAARARVRALGLGGPAGGPDGHLHGRVEVLEGTAQHLPLPAASVDVVHSRWAYFLGPGCEPGLAEVARVLRPGGWAFVVDTDAARSTFGGWFARAHPGHDAAAVARFWRRQGVSTERLEVRWAMPDRATFEAVVRLELGPAVAAAVLPHHPGTEVDHALLLHRWRRA